MEVSMKNKYIKNCVGAIFVLLPIIELIRETSVKDIEIFGISIIELVNIVLIGIAFLIFFFSECDKKKKVRFGIYAFLLLIYIILHCINNLKFDTSIYLDASPNWVTESYYILRQYGLPIILLIMLSECKNLFDDGFYSKIVKYLVCLISGSVVVLNLCRYSYSSYLMNAEGIHEINRTCFLDIFGYSGNAKELLTSGLFPSANRLSIILFMLLPLNIKNFYKDNKISNMLLVCLQVLSMVIVGTKTAAYGALLTVLALMLAYIFFVAVKHSKYKFNKYFLRLTIIVVFAIVTVFTLPFSKLSSISVKIEDKLSTEHQEIYDSIDDVEIKDLEQYLIDNEKVFKISKSFFEIYPVESDPTFWVSVAKRGRTLNNDNRVMKQTIMARVEERNNNPLDKYLGMGYTVNFIDGERDYVYQYYLFGICGIIILMGPYIVEYIKKIIVFFSKRGFNYESCFNLLAGFVGLAGAYFSGHLFGWTAPMFILAFVISSHEEGESNES